MLLRMESLWYTFDGLQVRFASVSL
jgi:hypothetical protein